jgi:hypothetical protein
VDVISAGRQHGMTSPSTAIPEGTVTTTAITPDRYYSKYTDIPMHSSSTASDYSDIPTTVKLETDNKKYEDTNTIYTSQESTVRSADIESSRNLSAETVTDPDLQTTPSPTTTPITLGEVTPQVPPIPETVLPPTTTRLTPTVTRIVTSVTESGTTERQIIAVNRVPYIAIAALRGQTVYPGPVVHNMHEIVPNDERMLNRTTATTVPFQPESTSKSLVEESTSTVHSGPKLEKVMEVNRVTLVTLKEEKSLGSTRATFGNETTERILAEGKPDKEMNKVSQVPHGTTVGGSLAVTPVADYTTGKLQEVFTTLSTPLVSLDKKTHLENAIDAKDEILSVKSHNFPPTSSYSPDNFSADALSVTEHSLSSLTSKQTDPITDRVDETTSVSPLNNRRRQGSGRKPGIDDFKRSRTRPTFSTTSAEPVASSSSSPIYQKRRGQRKRPRPYRPTSTTEADEEVRVLPDTDKTNARDEAVNADQNNEHRRTFIPKRGQRKRPRPDLPTSTSANVDEVANPLKEVGGEDIVLVTESIANTSVGFIPKRGNRRRGTTEKPTTETSNLTTRTTAQRDEIGTLPTAVKELNDVNNSFSIDSTEPDLPDSPDSIKSSTQGVDTFSSEHKSAFVPKENRRYRTSSTESSSKSELSDHIEVSTIRHSQRTGSYPVHNASPESELHRRLTSDSNSTENTTKEGDQQAQEVTYRPSSTSAYTESVTEVSTKSSSLSSSESGTGRSDRVRVKKRRRRPPPAQNVKTPEESSSEFRAFSGNKVDNDNLTDLAANRNVSGNTAEENSVTSFATAALLGREDYEIRTPSSVGEFLTTVDREGKHVVKISVLNEPKDTAASVKTQRGKSDSNRHKDDDKNATAHNPSNNYETSSYNSGLTTDDNNDLNTDGSGHATGDEVKNSIYPFSDYLKPLSEDHDSSLNFSLDVPNEEISRANSSKASTSQHAKNHFVASVDFTADPAGDQTLGSTAAIDSDKKGSANPDGKTRRLVRRKRPSSTTEGPQVRSEVG